MNQFDTAISVSPEELEELKRQAEELNQRIKELSNPVQIAPYVKQKPLDVPRNLSNKRPVFGFTERCNCDAWNAFVKLAKTVHTESPEFYMDTAYSGFCNYKEPFIRYNSKNPPRSIRQLTHKQLLISAEMLNEMIEIYNKYFVMLHTEVTYDPKDGSGARKVTVISPDEEMEEV